MCVSVCVCVFVCGWVCVCLCVCVCVCVCVVLAEVSASAGEYDSSLGGGLRRHARCAEWCVLALEGEEGVRYRVRLVIKCMDVKRALVV